MHINNSPPPSVAPAPRTEAANPAGRVSDQKVDSRAGSGSDQVQMSGLATQLSGGALPARLAQLQSAIDAGTYNVSPHDIARSMMNQMLQKG